MLGRSESAEGSQVEDEEGRTHLLIHLPIEEGGENRGVRHRDMPPK